MWIQFLVFRFRRYRIRMNTSRSSTVRSYIFHTIIGLPFYYPLQNSIIYIDYSYYVILYGLIERSILVGLISNRANSILLKRYGLPRIFEDHFTLGFSISLSKWSGKPQYVTRKQISSCQDSGWYICNRL